MKEFSPSLSSTSSCIYGTVLKYHLPTILQGPLRVTGHVRCGRQEVPKPLAITTSNTVSRRNMPQSKVLGRRASRSHRGRLSTPIGLLLSNRLDTRDPGIDGRHGDSLPPPLIV